MAVEIVLPDGSTNGSIRLIVVGQIIDTEAPTAPTGLIATSGDDQVGLIWTAASDNVAVTGYRIRRNGAVIGQSVGTSYTDDTAINGTTYSYTVAALDASNNESAQSAPATATPSLAGDSTPPSTPGNFTVTAGELKNTLAWSASTDNVGVVGYRIRKGGNVLTTMTSPGYVDTDVTSGTSYSYTVTAYDAAGNESTPTTSRSGTPTAAAGQFFTDFSSDTVGALPSGWTEAYDTSADWSIASEASASGGKTLRMTGGTGRRGMQWNAPSADPNRANVEIVCRWRTVPGSTVTDASIRLLGRASGTGTNVTALASGSINSTNIGVANYVDDVADSATRSPLTHVVGQWFYMRVRYNGTTSQIKAWAGTPADEPAGWALTKEFPAPTAAGWVGLMAISNEGAREFDWIGVATGGGTAPKGTT